MSTLRSHQPPAGPTSSPPTRPPTSPTEAADQPFAATPEEPDEEAG